MRGRSPRSPQVACVRTISSTAFLLVRIIQKRRAEMTVKQFVKVPGVVSAFVAILLAGMFVNSTRVRAQHNDDDDNDSTESKIRIGFQIAPVQLNLAGKDRDLVGVGSYIVNAQSDCNG